jgi:UPF0755 protein
MKKRVIVTLVVLVLVLGGAVGVLLVAAKNYAHTPMVGTGETVAVDIPAGAGPRKTAELLAEKKVIDDPATFYTYVRYYMRAAGKLKSGELAFRDNQSPEEVLKVLLLGTPMTHKITIPEGLRIDEIARLLEKEGLADAREFEQRARDKEFCRSLEVPGDSLEGFLYPETYQFRKNTPTDKILSSMVEQYHRLAFTKAEKDRAEEIGMTELQAITLASIVEKETGAPSERSLISGVFHNRLKKNWELQTDPTVIYSVLLSKGSFNGDITREDLRIDHPYNTYRHKGLPPGPICSPGKEAIHAALFPESTEHMFFVSKNNGTHFFCKNLACHNKAVAQYQRGGLPSTDP